MRRNPLPCFRGRKRRIRTGIKLRTDFCLFAEPFQRCKGCFIGQIRLRIIRTESGDAVRKRFRQIAAVIADRKNGSFISYSLPESDAGISSSVCRPGNAALMLSKAACSISAD